MKEPLSGQQVSSIHPTGMLSCFFFNFWLSVTPVSVVSTLKDGGST